MSSGDSLSNNSAVGPEFPATYQTEKLEDVSYTNETDPTTENRSGTYDCKSIKEGCLSQETIVINPSEEIPSSTRFQQVPINKNQAEKKIKRVTGCSKYDFSNQQVNKFVVGNLIIKRVNSTTEDNSVHNVIRKDQIDSPNENTEQIVIEENDDCQWMNLVPYTLNETNQESQLQHENKLDIEVYNEDSKRTCRLCLKEAFGSKNIFKDRLEGNVPIPLAILACIYPIEISTKDPLSKYACCECLQVLSDYFKFRSFVLKNDRIQRQKLGLVCRLDSGEESSENKRTLDEDIEPKPIKRRKKPEYGTELDQEDIVNMEIVSNSQNISSTRLLVPSKKCTESKPEDLQHLEKTLRNILKETLTPEQQEAEHIIIHVENDKELDNVQTTPKLQSMTLFDDLLREKEMKTVIPGTRKIIGGSKPKVILQEDKPHKESKYQFHSTIGVFDCTSVTYIFNISFCIADGYLLEYRLVKGNTRYLRCAVTNCNAVGTQKVIRPGVFSNKVKITKHHNHHKPTKTYMKKQMFFSVMRKKLQNDKGLNFKAIYEEICKLDPEIPQLVPLSSLINEICNQRWNSAPPEVTSFEQFYNQMESDAYHKIHFTTDGTQFYQEKFTADDNAQAVIFANFKTIDLISSSKLMYVDCSFKIDTSENFTYHLLTVLVWVQDSYYPVMFALLSQKSQPIYKKVFTYLRDTLMPKLNPEEIITDYEANLYYALGETFISSNISGSAFYYTQNIYKEICTLNLCRDLETNSYFRNIYHMLLMLPLLPVNTILDGLNNIEIQARDLGLQEMARPLFDHIRNVWIRKVTPELFCVHRIESRINENVVAPFKKLRDFLMLSKGKSSKRPLSIVIIIERIIEVENFLHTVYFLSQKKWVTRDLNCAQKKSVVKAWQFIENHPKININNFFTKVLGFIKCMENQLWIWGFYRFTGGTPDDLIDAGNFSIMSTDDVSLDDINIANTDSKEECTVYSEMLEDADTEENSVISPVENIVMEGVIDENGTIIVPDTNDSDENQIDPSLLTFIRKGS